MARAHNVWLQLNSPARNATAAHTKSSSAFLIFGSAALIRAMSARAASRSAGVGRSLMKQASARPARKPVANLGASTFAKIRNHRLSGKVRGSIAVFLVFCLVRVPLKRSCCPPLRLRPHADLVAGGYNMPPGPFFEKKFGHFFSITHTQHTHTHTADPTAA